MTVEKPKPKQLLRPITTGTNSAMNQSQFLAVTCNSLKAREKSRVHGAIGFAFASHWLKNWRESFKPITKRSNRNHAITFDSHLKTALHKNSFSVNGSRSYERHFSSSGRKRFEKFRPERDVPFRPSLLALIYTEIVQSRSSNT